MTTPSRPDILRYDFDSPIGCPVPLGLGPYNYAYILGLVEMDGLRKLVPSSFGSEVADTETFFELTGNDLVRLSNSAIRRALVSRGIESDSVQYREESARLSKETAPLQAQAQKVVRERIDFFVELSGQRSVAVLGLYFVDYKDSGIGSYREFVAYVPLIRGGRIYMFVWKVRVTSYLSLEVGRELWGFPKLMAEISIHDSNVARDFRLILDRGLGSATRDSNPSSKDGPSIWGCVGLGRFLLLPIKNEEYRTVTLVDKGSVVVSLHAEGTRMLRPFDPSIDRFELEGRNNGLAAKLRELGFLPATVEVGSEFKAELDVERALKHRRY